jgi:hypothetical protein
MFFRRAVAKHLTFEDHMNAARSAGFAVSPAGGKSRISRNGIATIAQPGPDDFPVMTVRAGVIMGDEIGTLTDGGFQKFFVTPTGKRKPALAPELKEIQAFQEDLREALDLTSLYNESLGTVSNLYLYDRVEGRDKGGPHKAWEVKTNN